MEENEPEPDLRSILNQRKNTSAYNQISHLSDADEVSSDRDNIQSISNESKKPSACSRISYRCSDTDEESNDTDNFRSISNERIKPSAFSRISYRCSDTDEDSSDHDTTNDLRNELPSSIKSDLRSRLGVASKDQHRSPLVSK